MLIVLKKCKHFLKYPLCRHLEYTQGQAPKPKIREYFYFIDHQGQLFLDDARMKNFTSCFKEKIFLEFFFTRLKLNDTGRYSADFPYFSPCGRERNYIRCDDLPIVFTHVIDAKEAGHSDLLSYNGAGDLLTVPFEPEKICMLPDSGRVYHPASDQACGVALIKSSLAIQMSKNFEFADGEEDVRPPTHFTWKGTRYVLTNDMVPLLKKEQERKLMLFSSQGKEGFS